jgi:hypothetical protein
MTPERVAAAVRMRAQGDSLATIARTLGVGASSVSRALARPEPRPVSRRDHGGGTMSEKLDLYHRTRPEAAQAILDTGRFLTRENTPEAYVTNRIDGQTTVYGVAIVHVRVDERVAQLEDEFPSGEQHYRIPLEGVEIVEAFTFAPDGARAPLTRQHREPDAQIRSQATSKAVATSTSLRGASFPAGPAPSTGGVIAARPQPRSVISERTYPDR